nr:MAG TPA: hypothetical protein [Caudoviricetes sp.]
MSTPFIIFYSDQSIFPNVTFFLFNSINSLFQNFNINFTFMCLSCQPIQIMT